MMLNLLLDMEVEYMYISGYDQKDRSECFKLTKGDSNDRDA